MGVHIIENNYGHHGQHKQDSNDGKALFMFFHEFLSLHCSDFMFMVFPEIVPGKGRIRPVDLSLQFPDRKEIPYAEVKYHHTEYFSRHLA